MTRVAAGAGGAFEDGTAHLFTHDARGRRIGMANVADRLGRVGEDTGLFGHAASRAPVALPSPTAKSQPMSSTQSASVAPAISDCGAGPSASGRYAAVFPVKRTLIP